MDKKSPSIAIKMGDHKSLSDMIEHALIAFKDFESKPNCVVDMDRYHKFNSATKTCYAYLGGVAALAALNHDGMWITSIDALSDRSPYSFSEIDDYESVLDLVRLGNITNADMCFYNGGSLNEDQKSLLYDFDWGSLIVDYDDDPNLFKLGLGAVINELRSIGL